MMKTYERYKNVKFDWLLKLPENWSYTQIKYLKNEKDALFIDGDWIESNVITESGIRYLTTGNIGPGFYKEQGHGYISEKTFIDLNCTEVFPGDLVISRLNEPIGRSCIIPNLNSRVVVAVDNVILRPKKGFDKKYIMYVMNSPKYSTYTSLISRGATMQRISRGQLGNIRIPNPSLMEQTQIAKFLDYQTGIIDELIAKKERLIDLLKEKRQAVINEAVIKGLDHNAKMKDSGIEWLGEVPEGWHVTYLKRYCTKISDGSHFSPKTEDEGRNYVSVKDLDEFGKIDLINCKKISDEEYHNLVKSGSRPNYNDVLLSKDGTIGKACTVKENNDFVILSSLGIITPDQNFINSDYLRLFLISSLNIEQMFSLIAGAALTRLTIDKMKHIIIPIPNLELQEQIVLFLEEKIRNFDRIIKMLSAQILKLKEYRQSIISEAVTGKIDVREWEPTIKNNA